MNTTVHTVLTTSASVTTHAASVGASTEAVTVTMAAVTSSTNASTIAGRVTDLDGFVYYTVAGSLMMAFALWWFINILGRYFHSLGKNGTSDGKFESSATYTCNCCPCSRNGTLELEGLIKIILAMAATILSILNHINRTKAGNDLPEVHAKTVKVTSIVVFFGAQGIVDLVAQSSTFVPRGVEYIGTSLCFLIEGVLIAGIEWGPEGSRMESLHQVLVYIAVVTSIVLVMEMIWRHAAHIALFRASLLLLQGLWLWQIAFRSSAKDYNLSVSLLLAWTIAATYGCLLFVSLLMGVAYRCCGGVATDVDYYKYDDKDGAVTQLIKRDANGHTIINFNDDSDSETEFEQSGFIGQQK